MPPTRQQPGSVSTAIELYPHAEGLQKELAEERLYRFLTTPAEAAARRTLEGYGPAVDHERAAESGKRETLADLRDRKLRRVTNREQLKATAILKTREKAIAQIRVIEADKRGNNPNHLEFDNPDRPLHVPARDLPTDRRLALDKFLKACTPEERQLCDYLTEDLKYKEIAEGIGITPNTLRARLQRLRAKAQKYLIHI